MAIAEGVIDKSGRSKQDVRRTEVAKGGEKESGEKEGRRKRLCVSGGEGRQKEREE